MAPPAPSAGVRLLLLRRLLSTATEAAAEAAAPTAAATATAAKAGKKGGSLALYRRLSALGRSGEGSVSRVLNKWVREGGALRVEDLFKHVKELRKYKRHAHALEVHTTGGSTAHSIDACTRHGDESSGAFLDLLIILACEDLHLVADHFLSGHGTDQ